MATKHLCGFLAEDHPLSLHKQVQYKASFKPSDIDFHSSALELADDNAFKVSIFMLKALLQQ